MAANFDPYHAWLGIPKGSRPLNHYQLLGLPPLTSEPPVIAEAAEEQKSKVSLYLAGSHRETASLVLDEIENAKKLLLNPNARRNYDAQLRQQLGMPPAATGNIPSAPAALPPQTYPSAAPVAAAPMPAAPAAAMAMPVQAMPVQGMPVQGMPMQAMPVGGYSPAMASPVMAAPVMATQAPYAAQAYAQPYAAQPYAAQPFGAPVYGAQPYGAADPYSADPYAPAPSMRRKLRAKKSSMKMAALGVGVLFLAISGVITFAFRDQLSVAMNEVTGEDGTSAATPSAEGKNGVRNVRVVSKTPPGADPTERHYNDVTPGPKKTVTHPDAMVTKAEPPKSAAPKAVAPKTGTPAAVAPKAAPPKKPEMAMSTETEMPAKPVAPKRPLTKASEQEATAVAKGLAAVRAALAVRDLPKAQEQLDLATLEAVSGDSLAAIDRTRQLTELVTQFWHAVHESVLGLTVTEEITIGDTVAIIVDKSATKLAIRAAGQNREYVIEKMPTNLARGLAERWLNKTDPNSKMFVAAFLAVDPKGDLDKARELLQQAAAGGVEVDGMLAELDALKR